jgi:hypothetical protein
MPEIRVCPVSASVRTEKVGSSAAKLRQRLPQLLLLALRTGLDRD